MIFIHTIEVVNTNKRKRNIYPVYCGYDIIYNICINNTFKKDISSRRVSNSSFNLLIITDGSLSSFNNALFLINETLCANLHVDNDSSVCEDSGLIVAIIIVLQFPPKLSLNTDVIIELRYGICPLPFVAFSYNATITISKKNKEVLIYCASVKTEPEEFVFATLSLPARSTRCSLERLTLSVPMTRHSKDMVKIQCEREDAYMYIYSESE